MALPQSASPSSGSASGSASRGRGFNNCSSCNAKGCDPAIVTRSRSAPRCASQCQHPARARTLSPPGPLTGRLYPSPARNRAQLQATSGRRAGGGGAFCVTTGVARMKAEAPGRLKGFSPSRRLCACACVEGACGPRGSAQGDVAITSTDRDSDVSGICSLAKSIPQDFSEICLEIKCSVAVTHGG